MDFSLTEEQIMFRNLFRDFAQKEVAKVSKHTDEAEEPPLALLKKAAGQGFAELQPAAGGDRKGVHVHGGHAGSA